MKWVWSVTLQPDAVGCIQPEHAALLFGNEPAEMCQSVST